MMAENLLLSWIDYTLFGIMIGLSGVIGIYFGCFGKKQSSTSDYLLGGKKMKVFPVSMSLVASTLSGITLLGVPAEVYMYGMQFSMMVVSLLFVGVITNYLFLPVLYELELVSALDYLELRFDKKTKLIASVFYTIASCFLAPIVIYGPSLALNQVTGFNLHLIAILMCLICVFYTSLGGLSAVVWTDTVQFAVTLVTLCFVFILGTKSVGGLSSIWETSKLGDRLEFFNMDPDPTKRSTFWTVVVGSLGLWLSFTGTEPAGIQRFVAVPTLKDARKCLVVYIIFTIFTKFISCCSGLVMYTKYFNCDPLTSGLIKKPDQILPFYVLDVASAIPGISGLFIAGLFSTALSTLSTLSNTLSGIIYNDFIAPFMPSSTTDERASTLMKIITIFLGLLSIALMFIIEKLGTMFEIMVSLRGITTGPILGIFTLGLLFPFANKKGAYIGLLGSVFIMSAIIIPSQVYIYNGKMKPIPKPLDISGCNVTASTIESFISNYTSAINTTSTGPPICPAEEEPFWLFRISFHYYFLLGALLTVIIGVIVSLFTKSREDMCNINPNLISPCLRRFCDNSPATIKSQSIEKEMQIVNINRDYGELKGSAVKRLLQ